LDTENLDDDDIDYDAQRNSIEATFSNLESILTPDDILVVFISGHGNNDASGDTYFTIPTDERMYDYELSALVDNINCASMFFSV